MAAIDEMLMIEPPPAARIAGMAARVPRNTPLLFTSMMRSHNSTSVPSIFAAFGSPTSVPAISHCLPGYPACRIRRRPATRCFPNAPARLRPGERRWPFRPARGSQLADLGFQLQTLLVQNVPDYHRRTLPREQAGLSSALSSGAATDDGYLAFQSHMCPLCMSSTQLLRLTFGPIIHQQEYLPLPAPHRQSGPGPLRRCPSKQVA